MINDKCDYLLEPKYPFLKVLVLREVLSGMIKNISDVNDRLMDLNKKKKDLDKKDEIQKIANTTNNLFVGSTTELQKLLKKDISVLRDNHIYHLSLRVGRTEKVLWSCTLIAITHLIFALLQ